MMRYQCFKYRDADMMHNKTNENHVRQNMLSGLSALGVR